ncbi:protein of unknown function [Paraburkholderia kururiensis]
MVAEPSCRPRVPTVTNAWDEGAYVTPYLLAAVRRSCLRRRRRLCGGTGACWPLRRQRSASGHSRPAHQDR